jgi:nucleotide-binding universal stress UspA family protein
MSYKDMIVFLDGSRDNDARLDFALSMAKAHGARLTGVDVNAPSAFDGEWAFRAQSLEESLSEKARRVGVATQFRIADREATGWRNLYAYYSDLLIATQPNPDSYGKVLPAVPEDILVSAGVPMIVLPHQWETRPIENAVIAWSPSSQATRAVHDAIPLLRQMRKITVFAFGRPDGRVEDIDLLCDHLHIHGVVAESDRWFDTGDLTAMEALFASRAMEDADMLVAGAYSHSRFRETLFGGVTRELLHQFSVPIFVSH